MNVQAHTISVPRTARYFTLGPDRPVADCWLVCHGYGQLAADFLTPFQVIDDGTRRIVAPEGLSRFYTAEEGRKVGASWMTREFREPDIDDYVAFLDAVTEALAGGLEASATLTVLGFSQGVATACRWAARGRRPAERAILWGALHPPDLTGDDYDRLRHRGTQVDYVLGERDEYLPVERMRTAATELEARGLAVTTRTFPGGHRLESRTLRVLA